MIILIRHPSTAVHASRWRTIKKGLLLSPHGFNCQLGRLCTCTFSITTPKPLRCIQTSDGNPSAKGNCVNRPHCVVVVDFKELFRAVCNNKFHCYKSLCDNAGDIKYSLLRAYCFKLHVAVSCPTIYY